MPNKLKILFVDDDTSLSQLLEKVLSDRGDEVDVATDGMAALDKLKSQNYDIAVLDNYLPKMNGIDVLRQIRERNLPMKIIMITAVNEQQLTQESLALGADEILVKPFEFEKLLGSISRVCGKT